MKRSVLILALVLASPLCFAQEAPNPFTSQNTRPRTGVFTTITSGTSAFIFSVMAPVQKMLNESLASMTRALKGSRSLGGLLLVAALALAYGIFHAAGPGHGKTIVSSFLLANEGKIRESFIIGYLVAAVHALSALTVVLVLYYVIRGIFATGVEQANHWIQLVTFAVITVIGAVMLVRRAAGKGHHHHAGAHMRGAEDGTEDHEHGAGDQHARAAHGRAAARAQPEEPPGDCAARRCDSLPGRRGRCPVRAFASHACREHPGGVIYLGWNGHDDQRDGSSCDSREEGRSPRRGGRSRKA